MNLSVSWFNHTCSDRPTSAQIWLTLQATCLIIMIPRSQLYFAGVIDQRPTLTTNIWAHINFGISRRPEPDRQHCVDARLSITDCSLTKRSEVDLLCVCLDCLRWIAVYETSLTSWSEQQSTDSKACSRPFVEDQLWSGVSNTYHLNKDSNALILHHAGLMHGF